MTTIVIEQRGNYQLLANDKRKFRVADHIRDKHAERERIKKDLHYNEIDKYFDKSKTDAENLKALADNDIKVSPRTLTNYKQSRGYTTRSQKGQIGQYYDSTKTDAENLKLLAENGVKISRSTLMRYKRTLNK